jgi:hypothetical protein
MGSVHYNIAIMRHLENSAGPYKIRESMKCITIDPHLTEAVGSKVI